MSYFSSLNSFTSTEQQQQLVSTANSPFPRQRASSASLRPATNSSSKLSLSIAATTTTVAPILDPTISRDRAPLPYSAHPTNGILKASSPATPSPLRNTWVFWFRQQRAPGNKITNYEEGIKKVTAFSSVESFWSLQTHLYPPSLLQPTTDYLLFHSSVRRPVWEDPLNANGGKWIIRLRKGISDRLWEDLLIAIVGDQFDVEDGICGCVLSVRGNEDILSVWNQDDNDAEAKARIRDGIRRALALPPSTIMEYKSNNDSLHDKSSFRTVSSTSISTLATLGQAIPT